jgi:outer membrane protein OmpA-like peptidoglycan-associated protein
MQKGVILAAAVALLLPACASKKYVDEQTAVTTDMIEGVEGAVEANQQKIAEVERKVGDVDAKAAAAQKTGSDALAKGEAAMRNAEEAKALARGKLVLEVTISDDVSAFTVNKSDLPQGATAALDDLTQKVLGMNRRVYLEIEGHTDSTGTEMWNMELGLHRADAVRRYLNERGIPLYAMSIISYGEAKPVADNSTREGRAQNRRAVVRVLE